ncbi:CAP domain-containing protein [Deinococcus apachensis]|uniref:CAP domain-containing protein n=1 Tax=Deinococcus apachensis TaxID=309886 RepID=UPI00036014FB|nr:CAP domain-containing protein [Deinococcus apachensis]
MKSQSLLILLGSATLLLAACGQTPGTTNTTAATPTAEQRLSTSPEAAGVTPLAVTPIALTVGQTYQVNVYYGGQPVTPALVNWTSSNAGVATVDQYGLVTARGAGTVTVRVALRSNPATFLDFPVNVTKTATAPAPTPATGTTSPSAFEQRVLELTNQARAQGRTCGSQFFPAAAPLSYNAALRTAAYNHSKDMAVRNFFSHTNPDGLDPFARMRAAGYTNFTSAGENIAAGQSTPEQVVAGWLQSPGHCANIMNAGYRDLGVGYYAGGSYRYYWTQDFGRR